jgi:tetratricopeptide (TPR) repeat protein
MRLRGAVLGLILANMVAVPAALAQLVGDRTQVNCGNVTRGNVENSTVTNICGMAPEQVMELVRLAASPLAGDRTALYARLSAIVPANSRFPVEAVARFLEILHEQPVEDTKLADRFAQIAQEHVRLLEEIRAFRVMDPEVQALREAAAAALQGAPNHDLARAKLEEARNLVRAKRQAVAKVLADQQREEAALVREQAKIETARLRFADAAGLYEQAATLLPAVDHDQRGADLVSAGLRWTDQGRDFGDNAALKAAVTVFRAALLERTRERVPLDWAATQNNLGAALRTLGERETGTARLDDAVTAYRSALLERTRERVPLDWATTQNNLGSALQTLGERETGTARLDDAVTTYRAALLERTRERVPLDWAQTENNLGDALRILGERETDTSRLDEAVAAWDSCLTVVSSVWPPEWVQSVSAHRDQVQAEIMRRAGNK